MSELGEPITPPPRPNNCSTDCPFCASDKFLGYKTKGGNAKDEKRLRDNLRAKSVITNEPGIGKIYPLQGGGDRTSGWLAKEGALEDFPVAMAAAPHHLIPGKASMAKSRLEKWTKAEKNKIKEDIGYNIDCAQNGIFLPHLPEIYWTKHKAGTKTPQSKFYGASWSELSNSSKTSIGFLIMGDTWLQMHYTDHDDPYKHIDNDTNYDDQCKARCNRLADLMERRAKNAKCEDDTDKKLNPPYELVELINLESLKIKLNITGRPGWWKDFVSPLAQDFWNAINNQSYHLSSKGLISVKED